MSHISLRASFKGENSLLIRQIPSFKEESLFARAPSSKACFSLLKLAKYLAHCILVDSSTGICGTGPFAILGVSVVYFVAFILSY